MVLIAFDDAVQERQMGLYTSLFGNFKNPNGCPINVTFFVSNKDTQYSAVKKLYRRGNRIFFYIAHVEKGNVLVYPPPGLFHSLGLPVRTNFSAGKELAKLFHFISTILL